MEMSGTGTGTGDVDLFQADCLDMKFIDKVCTYDN